MVELDKFLFLNERPFTCTINASSNKALTDNSILVLVFTNRGSTVRCTECVLIRCTSLALLFLGASSLITLGTRVTFSWTTCRINNAGRTLVLILKRGNQFVHDIVTFTDEGIGVPFSWKIVFGRQENLGF